MRSLNRLWRGAIFRAEGGVRAIWKLLLAYALYALWAYAAVWLLSLGFGALFDAWNLNAATLPFAPPWARWLAAHYGRIMSLAGNGGALFISHILLRRMAGGRAERLRAGALGVGAGLGALVVSLGAGLFLWLDSMRMLERVLTWSTDLPWMLAIYALAALTEERFARTLALRVAGPRWGYFASVLVFTAMTGSWGFGPLGMLNMLLTGFLCAHWSARGRAGFSVGFRFAWSFFANMVFGFPGANTGAVPLLSLYAVSEHWLTGGGSGLICGLFMTAALLALALPATKRPAK